MPVVLEKIERIDAKVAHGVAGAARPREQEPLSETATHVAKDLELLPGLDAFGHDLDVEAARHGDDCADDGVVGRIAGDVALPVSTKAVTEPRYAAEELYGVIPKDTRQPYDIREVIARIVDDSDFHELSLPKIAFIAREVFATRTSG